MISLLNDRYKLTNHIWKWKEDLMVNLLMFQPPILTCIEPDTKSYPFHEGSQKTPQYLYITKVWWFTNRTNQPCKNIWLGSDWDEDENKAPLYKKRYQI